LYAPPAKLAKYASNYLMRDLRHLAKLRVMPVMLLFLLLVLPMRALGCGLALVLAVDVSGSVDRQEYRIQMEGLATALRDGIVVDALISQQAHVSLLQWSGSSRQKQTIGWTALNSEQEVADLAQRVATDPRQWRNYSTAIGEALTVSIASFDPVAHCRRKVIDVSGDGRSNEGIAPEQLRSLLVESGVTVNALAIETEEDDLTAYFFENLIVGEGAFVITATGFEDYPEQIIRKLRRETTKQLSRLE
jgi:Ca-activated chloride channel family protein